MLHNKYNIEIDYFQVNWLSTELTNSNFMVSAIHEDLSKKERDTEIYKFSSEST